MSEIQAPHLWIPRCKIIEPRDPFKARQGVQGFFRLQTKNRYGRVIRDSGEFPNLITDAILDAFATGTRNVDGMVVGTGNAAPLVSDTALQTQVASSTSTQSTSGGSNVGAERYCHSSITRRFPAPGVSHNLQEIGAYDGATLWSRALIVDGGGSPTTFVWDADEILDATYTFRLYPNLVDWTDSVLIAGVTRDVVLRTANVDQWDCNETGPIYGGYIAAGDSSNAATAYSGALAAVTEFPSGQLGFASRSLASYVTGSFARGATLTFGTTQANGNVQSVIFRTTSHAFGIGLNMFQFSMDPVITKTNVQVLSLYVETSWARFTPP